MGPHEDDPRASEAAVATSAARKKHCRWLSILVWAACTTLCAQITGVGGLKNVRVVSPGAVAVGETAALECQYDLEGAELYAVKWYKGKKEFYRYLPKEDPPTKVFPLPGINVDLSESDAHHVVLRDAGFTLTGRYRCEVSADAPSFDTALVVASLVIVEDEKRGVSGEGTNSDEKDEEEGKIGESDEDEEWEEEDSVDWEEEEEEYEEHEEDGDDTSSHVKEGIYSTRASNGKVLRSRGLGIVHGVNREGLSGDTEGISECVDWLDGERGCEVDDEVRRESKGGPEAAHCKNDSPGEDGCHLGSSPNSRYEEWDGEYGDSELWEEEEINMLAWQSGPGPRGCDDTEVDSLESMGGKQARWLGCDGGGTWNGEWTEEDWDSWWELENEDEDISGENVSVSEAGGCEVAADNGQRVSKPDVGSVRYHFGIHSDEADAAAGKENLGEIPDDSRQDRALKRLEADQLILNILEALIRVIDGFLELIVRLVEEGRHLEEEEWDDDAERYVEDRVFRMKEGNSDPVEMETVGKETREKEWMPDVGRLTKFIEGLRSNGQRELKVEGNDVVNYKDEGEWYELDSGERGAPIDFNEKGEESEDGDLFLPEEEDEEDLGEELVPFLPGVAIDGPEFGGVGVQGFEGVDDVWETPRTGAGEGDEFLGGGLAGGGGVIQIARRSGSEVMRQLMKGGADERFTGGGGKGLADEGMPEEDAQSVGEGLILKKDEELWDAEENNASFSDITESIGSHSDDEKEIVGKIDSLEGMEESGSFVHKGVKEGDSMESVGESSNEGASVSEDDTLLSQPLEEQDALDGTTSDQEGRGELGDIDLGGSNHLKEFIGIEEEKREGMDVQDESEDCISHYICDGEKDDITDYSVFGEINSGLGKAENESYSGIDEDKIESKIPIEKLSDIEQTENPEASVINENESKDKGTKERGIEGNGNEESEDFAAARRQDIQGFDYSNDIEVQVYKEYFVKAEAEQESVMDFEREVGTGVEKESGEEKEEDGPMKMEKQETLGAEKALLIIAKIEVENKYTKIDKRLRTKVEDKLKTEIEKEVKIEVGKEKKEVDKEVKTKEGKELRDALKRIANEGNKEPKMQAEKTNSEENKIVRAEAENEVKSKVEERVETEVQMKMKTEVPNEVKARAKEEVEWEVGKEEGTGVEKEVKSEVRKKLKMKVEEERMEVHEEEVVAAKVNKLNTETRNKLRTEVEKVKGMQLKEKVETEVDGEVKMKEMKSLEMEVKNEVGTEVENEVKTELDNEQGTKGSKLVRVEIENEIKMEVNKDLEREVKEERRAQVRHELETEAKIVEETKVENEVGIEVEKELKREMRNHVIAEISKEMNMEVENEVGTEIKKAVRGEKANEKKMEVEKDVRADGVEVGEERNLVKVEAKIFAEEDLDEYEIELKEKGQSRASESKEQLFVDESLGLTEILNEKRDNVWEAHEEIEGMEEEIRVKEVERVEDEPEEGKKEVECGSTVTAEAEEGEETEIGGGKLHEVENFERAGEGEIPIGNEGLSIDEGRKTEGERSDQFNESSYVNQFDKKITNDLVDGQVKLVDEKGYTAQREGDTVEGAELDAAERDIEENGMVDHSLQDGSQNTEKESRIDERLAEKEMERKTENVKVENEELEKVEKHLMSGKHVGIEKGDVIKTEGKGNAVIKEKSDAQLERESIVSNDNSQQRGNDLSQYEVNGGPPNKSIILLSEVDHPNTEKTDFDGERQHILEPHHREKQTDQKKEGINEIDDEVREDYENVIEKMRAYDDESGFKNEVKWEENERKEKQTVKWSTQSEIRRETVDESKRSIKSTEELGKEERRDSASKTVHDGGVVKNEISGETPREDGRRTSVKMENAGVQERIADSFSREAQSLVTVEESKVGGRMGVNGERGPGSVDNEDVKPVEEGDTAGGGKKGEMEKFIEDKESPLREGEGKDARVDARESKGKIDQDGFHGNREIFVDGRGGKLSDESLSGDNERELDSEVTSATQTASRVLRSASGIRREKEEEKINKANVDGEERKELRKNKNEGDIKKEGETLHRDVSIEVGEESSTKIGDNNLKIFVRDSHRIIPKIEAGSKCDESHPFKEESHENKVNDAGSVEVLPQESKIISTKDASAVENKTNDKEVKVVVGEEAVVDEIGKQTEKLTEGVVNKNSVQRKEI